MPELRYNAAVDDWIIIATERAKRPEDFASKSYVASQDSGANCPFCAGREAKTPQEIFAIRDSNTAPNTAGWQVRVIPNAFPALQATGDPTRSETPAGFLKMNGVGKHEVIIESPAHDQIIANMGQKQVENICLTYKERVNQLTKSGRYESIILFKNHGHNAGTSLSHPHSQLIALPIIPRVIRERLEIGQNYFTKHNSCLYCDMIRMEKSEGQRIIAENEDFIAFVPYAARFPFETWILPKVHDASFNNITVEQCLKLAGTLKMVLEKLFRAVKNPDFNYAIYSSPCHDPVSKSYHWNLKIFPRITTAAGFELGSGIIINTVIPEMSAKYLQEA